MQILYLNVISMLRDMRGNGTMEVTIQDIRVNGSQEFYTSIFVFFFI